MKIVLCQLNPKVGDLAYNLKKILLALRANQNADLLIFPESFLTGYPSQDLLERRYYFRDISRAIRLLRKHLGKLEIIFGTPYKVGTICYNVAFHLSEHKIKIYRKQFLPNEGVFDEKRYFLSGTNDYSFTLKGIRFSLLICEDIWHQVLLKKAEAKCDCLITINASVYEINKDIKRRKIFENFTKNYIYLNAVSGQDELIFDGGSFASINNKIIELSKFQEETLTIDYLNPTAKILPKQPLISELLDAICFALKEFYEKNNFKNISLGISGGIDSALVLALATRVIARENINCFLLPYRFTSETSIALAKKICANFDVKLTTTDITASVDTFKTMLGVPENSLALQNLQSRIRGLILMTQTNLLPSGLLLNTTNKSELAMGYSTLYGDSVGGYAPLKDLCKTKVFEMAKFINANGELIPDEIITRPPTAELAENQTDQDDLPAYHIIDEFIEKFVENDQTFSRIGKYFMTKKLVRSEFKRFQAPPGPKLTKKSFAKLDWRYPITNAYVKT